MERWEETWSSGWTCPRTAAPRRGRESPERLAFELIVVSRIVRNCRVRLTKANYSEAPVVQGWGGAPAAGWLEAAARV